MMHKSKNKFKKKPTKHNVYLTDIDKAKGLAVALSDPTEPSPTINNASSSGTLMRQTM